MPKNNTKTIRAPRRRLWLLVAAALVTLTGITAMLVVAAGSPAPAGEPPEAAKIFAVQEDMPFQILIPAYLPQSFDRAGVDLDIQQSGPSGEPMVQLTYHTRAGETLFVRQWVPGNPEKEILANSRLIETRWGKGYLLVQGDSLTAIWADVGPLRVSVYTSNTDILPREQILAIADSLGPVSNRQVFSFVVDAPTIREVAPPAPFEVKPNAQGMQELTLVVTPGGYSPLRFAVKKGVPVRLTFRQLGQVGCGNELILPFSPDGGGASLLLKDQQDLQVVEFTPQFAGDFIFHCSHVMYRGVMTVRE